MTEFIMFQNPDAVVTYQDFPEGESRARVLTYSD